MSRKKRIIALLLTVVFSLLVIFSISYTVENANHSCIDKNHCFVCYQIHLSNQILKNLIPAAVLSAVVSFLYAVLRVILVPVELCSMATPVSMKVKLLN